MNQGQKTIDFFVYAHTPITERVDSTALDSMAAVVEHEIREIFSESSDIPELPIQIDFAYFPDGEHLEHLSCTGESRLVNAVVLDRCRGLAVPAVKGVVAWSIVAFVAGNTNFKLSWPFASQIGNLPAPLTTALNAAYRQPVAREWPAKLIACYGRLGMALVRAANYILRAIKFLPSGYVRLSKRPNCPSPLGSLSAELIQLAACCTMEELDLRISAAPDNPHHYFVCMLRYVAENNPMKALLAIEQLIELTPDCASAFLHRSECLLKLERFGEALEAINKALSLCPDYTHAHSLRGFIYLHLEAWDAAEKEYSRCIELNELCSYYRVNRVCARLAASRMSDAIDDLDEAIRLNPYDIDGLQLRVRLPYTNPDKDRRGNWPAEYITHLERAARFAAPSPELLVRQADVDLTNQAYGVAVARCEQALESNPDFTIARAIRGIGLMELNQIDDALDDFTLAIDAGIELAEVYVRRAQVFIERCEWELASHDLETALQIDSGKYSAYILRGQLMVYEQHYLAAEKDFRRAIELEPDRPDAYFFLGRTKWFCKDFQEADRYFSTAIDLNPEVAAGWLHRGLCRVEMQQDFEAKRDLNRCLQIDASLVPALVARAQIWSRCGLFDSAIEDVTTAIQLEPDDMSVRMERARLLYMKGDFVSALNDWDEIVRLRPNDESAYVSRGYIATLAGNAEQAASDFRQAISCEPSLAQQIQLQQLIAQAEYNFRQEAYQIAIGFAQEALSIEPDCFPALQLSASAHWYDEEFVEAFEAYSQLLEEFPASSSILSSRGQVLIELGEYQAALVDLDKSLALADASRETILAAHARGGRALALAALERWDESDNDFEASIAICPGNAWVHYNQGRAYDLRSESHHAKLCYALSLAADDPSLTPRLRRRARARCNQISRQLATTDS